MASQEKIKSFVDGFWDGEILPAIQDYIRVPRCFRNQVLVAAA